jgi:hypothetical protein
MPPFEPSVGGEQAPEFLATPSFARTSAGGNRALTGSGTLVKGGRSQADRLSFSDGENLTIPDNI